MQIRILAGFSRLMMVLAIASLIIAPVGAATPLSQADPAGGAPLSASAGRELDDRSTAVQPILYSRPNNSWPYSSGPVYSTVNAASWNAAGVLHTQVGSFDMTAGVPNLPTELRAANKLDRATSQYFVMQIRPESFTDGTFDALKKTIIAQGGSIVGEMPVAAFIVRMTPGAHAAVRDSASILALQPYQPAFKLSPEIGRVPLLDPVKAASSVYSLKLLLFPGESVEAVSASLKAMGLQVKGNYSDVIFVDADRSKLAAIAALDPIFVIEEVLSIFLMSEETSTTIQTGQWNNGAAPYTDAGVDGGGVKKILADGANYQDDDQLLMIIDNGIQLDAGDLSDSSSNPGTAGPGHRKVAFYGTTQPFTGSGDLLGCDDNTTSGVTHGHTVAAVALGNASRVNVPTYGTGFYGTDASGNFWGLDGVAPKARLIAYDGQITPRTGRCDDVTQIPTPLVGLTPLDVGDVTLALNDGYAKGARTVNFSWGSVKNLFDTNAIKIDAFLVANPDSMVFVAAGNNGRDATGPGDTGGPDRIPDPNRIGTPGTARNIICVGASSNADDLGDSNLPNRRWPNSSNGPATSASNRIAPLLMAPGTDAGGLGLASEFHCRSNDNNQTAPVECDVISGQISTSYASAAAAGAGMLVRDYFAQGFYPNGARTPGAEVSSISGALLKAILVASAEWMHGDLNSGIPVTDENQPYGPQLTRKFRGNREQGFGRIKLTNVLPLQSYPGAVSGLIVGDGAGPISTSPNSTTLDLTLPYPATQSYILNVCDTSQPLTVAIAWTDPSTSTDGTISRDLDLEVVSPSGKKYLGNFFTDDGPTNPPGVFADNGQLEGNENCVFTGQPWPPDLYTASGVDSGPWSLPSNSCILDYHVDHNNPVEAVFLSPDSRLNGINDESTTTVNEGLDNQIEQGAWTVRVKNNGVLLQPNSFSIAIAGGVCLGSAVRVQRVLPNNQLAGTVLSCNDLVVATVDEIGNVGDPISGLTTTAIAGRTKLEVVDANNVLVDSETLPASKWSQVGPGASNNLRFESGKIVLTDGTAPESGNGVLDVRDGQRIRVTYTDVGATRVAFASVSCRPAVAAGGVLFGQFGKDAFTLVNGGCEKDARGYFTFGFPDRYMDEGELVSYSVAFQSAEISTDLVGVSISLRAVLADADSPANCKPGTTACADPNRTNNTAATALLTVLDSPKVYGVLPSGATLTPSFTIQMAPSITGVKKVDMLIGVTAKAAGKAVESLIAQRETLNADEVASYYSTDFPLGGTEPVGGYDINNNETLETVASDPRFFTNDYVFETRSYSDMTVTSTNSLATIKAPWNFDTDNGGFVNGLNNTTRPPGIATMSQWGEDLNFNGRLDGYCSLPPPGSTTPTIPCTQGIAASSGCQRCSLNFGRECLTDANCQSPLPNDGVCLAAFGTCNYALGEDRDPAQGILDTAWSKLGGCGWQSKFPGDATGGAWHTGLIRSPNTGTCLAAGNGNGDCQGFSQTPVGDTVGDNNWWELLVTPVLHKVNQQIDNGKCSIATGTSCTLDTDCPSPQTCVGDPVYQVAITDWAWNMSVDLTDTITNVTLEFDTDVNKTAGAELFNDAAVLVGFRGKQGAYSGGNGPITGGFNLFQRPSNCQDTDGNGTLDHCGTAAGKLCGANRRSPDRECNSTGAALGSSLATKPFRGLCSTAPTQKRCTGARNLFCNNDGDCNKRCSLNADRACNTVTGSTCDGIPTHTTNVGSPGCGTSIITSTCGVALDGVCADQVAALGWPYPGEKCVLDPVACTGQSAVEANTVCSTLGLGTCVLDTGPNREGQDNCVFLGPPGERTSGPGFLIYAREPYGLASPPDDDLANGYCSRSDGLTIDKSASCSSVLDCEAAGGPYASVRGCSGRTAVACTANINCGACSSDNGRACTRLPDGTTTDCPTGDTCTAGALGTCSTVVAAVCNPGTAPGKDEYVQNNGPGRNYGISTSNGPDMRFTTLEDFYGDTGTAFRAALGFNNREPDAGNPTGALGLGVTVDDMVISWKETRLDPDTTSCVGSGECALLDSASTVAYEGNSVVSLTVTDKFPYDTANPKNNCNNDFVCSLLTSKTCKSDADCFSLQGKCVADYSDAGIDDTDCNNNGKLDVTVKLTSDAELAGEVAVLDQVAPGSAIYKANFPYSTLYDSPGTLFVVQSGTSPAIVTALYVDRNDGSNQPCKNAQEPGVQGAVTSRTTVAATAGRVTVESYLVYLEKFCSGAPTKSCTTNGSCQTCQNAPTRPCDTAADCTGFGGGACQATFGTCSVLTPGDDDGFADGGELINLVVKFANKSGVDVDDLSATLGTSSTTIECISRSYTTVGSLPFLPPPQKSLSNPLYYDPFQFKVKSNVNRTSLTEVLQAKFTLTVRSNKFDALTRATDIILDLDFDATGGNGDVASDFEDFEGTDFGKFTLQYLDAGKNSLTTSNGYRCQYNDPLALNSNSASNKDCFLGFTSDPTTGVNDWHIHTSNVSTYALGRAFTGKQSLHLGVHAASAPQDDTTTLRHIMSIRTASPVNVGLAGLSPELTFAQQVSFVDSTAGVNVSPGEAVDRGVVEWATSIVGPWTKLIPYENVYDQQGTDDFSNCVFDPVDDGNNEDSFYDPTDPARRLGPSSTCFPEFTFVHQGQTGYTKDFDATDIGFASDGPGLKPCSDPDGLGCLLPNTGAINNPGTWVRPKFSLVPIAGRSVFFRFLFTSIEIGATDTMLKFFGRTNSGDDGWYIDDIKIFGTLNTAVTLTFETDSIADIPCVGCSAITPILTAAPAIADAPGQIVTVSAKLSYVDRCLNGILQYQFWQDVNANGTVGDLGDTLLRDYTDNSTFVDAPFQTTYYGVKERCSTELTCDTGTSSATVKVDVKCPGAANEIFTESILMSKVAGPSATINWLTPTSVDAIRGSLSGTPLAPATHSLKAFAAFNTTVNLCLATNSAPTNSLADATDPGAGNAFYYLVRGGTQQRYTTGVPKERGYTGLCNSPRPRDTDLSLDTVPCP